MYDQDLKAPATRSNGKMVFGVLAIRFSSSYCPPQAASVSEGQFGNPFKPYQRALLQPRASEADPVPITWGTEHRPIHAV